MANLTPQEAARELLRRRLARKSLIGFANSIDIPGAPVSDDPEEWMFRPIETSVAKHHEIIMNTLDEVANGTLKRVMLFLPPGSAKSTYASVVFPAYYMGKFPSSKIILASYGSDLAKRMGRKARQIARSKAFAPIFDATLSNETSAADEWALTNGSEYMSGGILSGMTGNRACLTETTIVTTPYGYATIKQLFDAAYSGEVLSYDTNAGRVVYKRVRAVARRPSPDFYRLHSKHGNVVELTGDHLVWSGERFQPAGVLAEGDSLLRVVQSGDGEARLRNAKGVEAWRGEYVLQSLVQHPCDEPPEVGGLQQALSIVREEKAEPCGQILRPCMRGGRTTDTQRGTSAVSTMRSVREDFSPTNNEPTRAVLFNAMQEPGALAGDVWRLQSSMAGRGRREEVSLCKGNNCAAPCDSGSGREQVRCLWGSAQTPNAPHRFRCVQPEYDESGDTVQAVPRSVSCRRPFQAEEDSVSLVERVHQPVYVYDIQVEDTECFFANGILVHNCGILIDDPVKGRQEADSEIIQNRTWQAYQDDLLTRLIPGGWQIIIQTRWNEADLSGRILPKDWSGESGDIVCRDGETWRVVCIQAQCERADDPVGRQIGEYLWPGWFSEQHFAQFKRVPRTWNALYQQIPASEEGDYFRTDCCQWYETRPKHLRIYGASDYAVTDGGGDFTEHGIFGVDPNDDLYILDWWYGQTTSDVWVEEKLDLVQRHKPIAWYGEAGPIRRAVEPTLLRRSRERRVYCDFQWLASITDKPTRARGFQSRWAMRKVYLPANAANAPWAARLLRQLSRFPAGAEDDGVDVCSLIGRALDNIFGASAPTVEQKNRMDYSPVDDDDEEGWKTA